MKINILPSSVYNLISAGEVVENPASIVKELVENSIDAGANEITVKIEDGGIKSIEVSDNGAGIPKDELYKTVLPHATSKISEASDLESIGTLGFRGEALASIAAVSETVIKSKYFESQSGGILRSDASGVTVSDCALSGGTVVTVTRLFYNTPARFKFLKTPRAEGGAVTALMLQQILANPNIAFRYYSDGKPVFMSDGSGLLSAVNAVYERDITENLLPLAENDGKILVSGFISRPGITKNNKSFQTVILNGRVITDANISMTAQNAYAERLMRREFPVFILNILMPFDEVDINVHPGKREVRFARPREVYGAVYRAVKLTLELYEQGIKYTYTKEKEGTAAEKPETEKPAIIAPDIIAGPLAAEYKPEEKPVTGGKKADIEGLLQLLMSDKSGHKRVYDSSEELYGVSEIIGGTPEIKPEAENKTTIKAENPLKNYRVIGQLFSTYLLIEVEDKLLVVDQHAAHERLLYDELVKEADGGVNVQPMLVPYIYDASHQDSVLLTELMPELKAIGFDIEEFGASSFKFNAVPMLLSGIDLDGYIGDIIKQHKGKSLSLSSMIREVLMQAACKAAIKGGDSLNAEQVEAVVGYFFKNSLPIKCPHGRPAYITFTKEELEKLFRRKL